MKTIFEEIRRLTILSNTDKYKRLAKLMEEVGELSEAIISSEGEIGCSYKNKTKEDVLEEICDIIIVAMSTASIYDNDYKILKSKINKKLIKWNNNILDLELEKHE